MSVRIFLGYLFCVLLGCSQDANVDSTKTRVFAYENEAMWNVSRKDSYVDHLKWRESLGNSYIDPNLVKEMGLDLRKYIRSSKTSVDLVAVFGDFGVSEHLIRAIMLNPILREEINNESDLRLKACEYLRSRGEHGTAMYEAYSRCKS